MHRHGTGLSPSVGRGTTSLQSQLLPRSFCLSVSERVAPSAFPGEFLTRNPLPQQHDVEAQIYPCTPASAICLTIYNKRDAGWSRIGEKLQGQIHSTGRDWTSEFSPTGTTHIKQTDQPDEEFSSCINARFGKSPRRPMACSMNSRFAVAE